MSSSSRDDEDIGGADGDVSSSCGLVLLDELDLDRHPSDSSPVESFFF